MTTRPPSNLRQSYHPECEAAINYQISLELYASYVYESMASYFNSHEVALKHLVEFFLQQNSKEWEHAQGLMQLQNQRGGQLILQHISSPDPNYWENGLKAMEFAYHLKMRVNHNLLDLHYLATNKKDVNLCDFLKSYYLDEQVKFIRELGEHITNVRKIQNPVDLLADYFFEKLTLEDSEEIEPGLTSP